MQGKCSQCDAWTRGRERYAADGLLLCGRHRINRRWHQLWDSLVLNG